MAEIVVNIASLRENGKPTTEEVIEEFRGHGLLIRHQLYENQDDVARRGYVRNRQIAESSKDWIYFADADRVYSVDTFAELSVSLSKEIMDGRCNFTRAVAHTEIEAANALVEQTSELYIENAFERANELPKGPFRDRGVATGGMQIAHYETIERLCKGTYVEWGTSRDNHLFRQSQKARSDIQFRKRLRGSRQICAGRQIHLNHFRDKTLGYHLEAQR